MKVEEGDDPHKFNEFITCSDYAEYMPEGCGNAKVWSPYPCPCKVYIEQLKGITGRVNYGYIVTRADYE